MGNRKIYPGSHAISWIVLNSFRSPGVAFIPIEYSCADLYFRMMACTQQHCCYESFCESSSTTSSSWKYTRPGGLPSSFDQFLAVDHDIPKSTSSPVSDLVDSCWWCSTGAVEECDIIGGGVGSRNCGTTSVQETLLVRTPQLQVADLD